MKRKLIKRKGKTQAKTQDILDRYDNEEYWNFEIEGRQARRQDILDRYDNEEFWHDMDKDYDFGGVF